MKKLFLLVLTFAPLFFTTAQAPAQSDAVMLQGFYWDSNTATSWHQLYLKAGDIAADFDYVWLPPSAFSTGGTGYIPRQWSTQSGSWGTVEELKQLINALKANGCKAIADVVVNHRGDNGLAPYNQFFSENFGAYGTFQLLPSDVCSNDDVPGTGFADTGEGFDGARDLDHTSTNVQNTVKAYLQWLKNEIGYDGWRYDMVKGFNGSYISGYNAAADADLSVGEYWDAQYNAVWNWITATGKNSTAFDFPMKYAALNNGLQSSNYAAMAWDDNSSGSTVKRPAGIIHAPQSRRYAVTFVDNHDTYRDASKYTGSVTQAYAFILSAPGIPCVFYPHWIQYKTAIGNMIRARKAVGLHSESDVTVQNTDGYYKAYSIGTCGEMLTYIGNTTETPGAEWTLACEGTGWKIYTKINNTNCGTAHETGIANAQNPPAPESFTNITITANLPNQWTTPKIHVWNRGVSGTPRITNPDWPGQEMTQVTGNIWTVTLSDFAATKEIGIVFNNGTGSEQTFDLRATDTQSCWRVEHTVKVDKYFEASKIDDCLLTAVEESTSFDLELFPNPATELLTINGAAGKNLTVFDIFGKKILEKPLINPTETIDLRSFVKGIYLLQFAQSNGKIEVRKIAVK